MTREQTAIERLIDRLLDGKILSHGAKRLDAGGILTSCVDEDMVDTLLTRAMTGEGEVREGALAAMRKLVERHAPDYIREHFYYAIDDELENMAEEDAAPYDWTGAL